MADGSLSLQTCDSSKRLNSASRNVDIKLGDIKSGENYTFNTHVIS